VSILKQRNSSKKPEEDLDSPQPLIEALLECTVRQKDLLDAGALDEKAFEAFTRIEDIRVSLMGKLDLTNVDPNAVDKSDCERLLQMQKHNEEKLALLRERLAEKLGLLKKRKNAASGYSSNS